jgi:hypothetical protein
MDRLCFYSGSKQVPPGAGVGERVTSEYDLPFDFRERLSNFYMGYGAFEWSNEMYASIEHAFQATKFRVTGYPNVAAKFAVGGEWGADSALARKNRKAVVLSPELLVKWNGVAPMMMQAIASAFYYEKPAAFHLLKQTKDAELWHIVPRKKREEWIRFSHLENIREHLM